MSIKAIRPIWVGERLYHPGEIVEGLSDKEKKKAKAADKIVEIKEVKHANRQNSLEAS